jgi:hypothetical protein
MESVSEIEERHTGKQRHTFRTPQLCRPKRLTCPPRVWSADGQSVASHFRGMPQQVSKSRVREGDYSAKWNDS